jgi:hypothetical protein
MPEDSPSSTFSGMVQFAERYDAQFPLTLTLSQGRGNSAQRNADRSGLFPAQSRFHPLPKGEGWGEGKVPTQPPGADVLALVQG